MSEANKSVSCRSVVPLLAFIAALIGCTSLPKYAQSPSPVSSPSPIQTAQRPASDRVDRPTSEPYTGSLTIFEDPKRDEQLQVNRVMDVLGIKEGSNVADIGAGSGWFSVRAARRVGPNATVYAVDINEDYLKYIADRAEREKLPNIKMVLGSEDDPLLPERSVDAILLLKTYHEVAEPIRLLKHARDAMRPNAVLGIIDRNGKADEHGVDKEVVIEEAARSGFSLIGDYDFVKADGVDYFLVFRPKQ